MTLSLSGKKWSFTETSWQEVMAVAQKYDLPEVIARILVARGIGSDFIEDFLNPTLKKLLPNPLHLKDMDKAIALVHQTLVQGKKIAVLGDYDVDGATSSALLTRFFRGLGQNIRVYIPDRIDEGYGPNPQAMQTLKDEGHSLVITVDCGTTSFEALSHARDIGLDIIVLDHHIGEPSLPPCAALVNPNRLDETSPYKDLAAVGVSFLFCVALHKYLKDQAFPIPQGEALDLLSLLDLVAIGTVCDVMPLRGLNRAFVQQGLKIMKKRQNVGVRTLMDCSGLNEAPNVYHLGFVIGPRINAGGRVGKADYGSRLLRSDDEVESMNLAQALTNYNLERQEIERGVLEDALHQALSQEEKSVIVVSGQTWHPGVIGIVASRLKERFNRPACVISFDESGMGKASARSVSGFDFGSLIHAAKQQGILLGGGGHAMAGGFSIEAGRLEEFQSFACQTLERLNLDLTPRLTIDGSLSVEAASFEFVDILEQLAPYGQGNPTPRFMFENVSILKPEVFGTGHIRCILSSLGGKSIQALAFRSVDTALGEAILGAKGKLVNVVGTIKSDTWQGRRKISFFLDDLGLPEQQILEKSA